MTLKLIIRDTADLEFLGDVNELKQAEGILSGSCTFEKGQAIDWEDKNDPKIYPSFKINLYSLYRQIKDKSVSQVILKLMDDNKLNMSFRNRYMLQYWDYEVKMIVNGKSNLKKFNPNAPCHLSSPILLNTILNECDKRKYIPGFEQLFQFLEQSIKMRNNYMNPQFYFCKPYKFDLTEIKKFISNNENNLFISNDNKIHGKYELLMFDKKLTKVDKDYLPQATKNCLI
ncbi:Uncharacterised protein [Legionella busanensis]|uniref:Uncharacterized protein n=1 Tax=Legionella busanensis TaxID=190655 RepID=A0A378JL93_9GAMM|nr:hypothetical protein [Legionella busanensis]STX51837.1 Uncharacterised protein [Legionella busanensis]